MKLGSILIATAVLAGASTSSRADIFNFTVDPAQSNWGGNPLTGSVVASFDPFAQALTFSGGSSIQAASVSFSGTFAPQTFADGANDTLDVLSGTFQSSLSSVNLNLLAGTVTNGASAGLLAFSASGQGSFSGSMNVRYTPQGGSSVLMTVGFNAGVFAAFPGGNGAVTFGGLTDTRLDVPFGLSLQTSNGLTISGNVPLGFVGSLADLAEAAISARHTGDIVGVSSSIVHSPVSVHWALAGSGSWDQPSNWTPVDVPKSDDDLHIDPATSLTVTGPAADAQVGKLTVGGGAGIATLSLLGGTVKSLDDRVQVLANGVVTGDGTLAGGVLNQGTVVAQNLTIQGGLQNLGVITGSGRLNADINNTSGRISVGSGQSMRIGGTVNNSPTGTVEVIHGELETAGTFSNAGRIAAHDSVLRFDGGLFNSGQVLVGAGTLDVFGAVTNFAGSRVIASGGANAIFYDTVVNQGEMRASAASSIVYFGNVSGSGSFTGDGRHYFEGNVAPGNSPGVMTVSNATYDATSTLDMQLAGLLAGTQYDRIVATGDLTLDGGTLLVELINGFVPVAGNSFDLLDWGTLHGAFGAYELPSLGPSLAWNLDRLYVDGTISVAAIPEPGTYAMIVAGLGFIGFWRRRSLGRSR